MPTMHPLPSLFISHGAPTFALDPGRAGPALTALGRALPRPRAVLVVSPHWSTPNPQVGTVARPATIHDFGGFDPALYTIEYPVVGHPELAAMTLDALRSGGWTAQANDRRGLDHGAWVPLLHLYPQADVPVFQVSLPTRLDGESAWALGRALVPLAAQGVLVVGSGSLTHNLSEFRGTAGGDEPYAAEFAAWVRDAALRGDGEALRDTLQRAPHARRAHPTAEHFWPLLVAAGAARALLPARWIDGGIAYGMLVMDSIVFADAVPA